MSVAPSMIPPQAPPPAPQRRFTLARIAGIVFMALWLALFVALVEMVITDFDMAKFERYGIRMLWGLLVTLQLVGTSIVIGAILSLPLAFARMSQSTAIATLASGYIYLFRGTPLIMQVFLIYYGLGSLRSAFESVGLWWFFREAWYCAILAFSLNTSAYQAEILRGAIQSVPKGQWEGAASLGLHPLLTLRKIVLPQAFIVALRPYGNEIILLIKGSAVVALVTVADLMGETRLAYARSFDFQAYIWAAIIYLAVVEALRHAIDWIERRLTRHLHR